MKILGAWASPVFRGWENRNFVRPISVAFSPSMLFRPSSLFFIFAAARPCPGIAVRRLTWKRSSTPCSEQHAASSSSPLPSGKQEISRLSYTVTLYLYLTHFFSVILDTKLRFIMLNSLFNSGGCYNLSFIRRGAQIDSLFLAVDCSRQ